MYIYLYYIYGYFILKQIFCIILIFCLLSLLIHSPRVTAVFKETHFVCFASFCNCIRWLNRSAAELTALTRGDVMGFYLAHGKLWAFDCVGPSTAATTTGGATRDNRALAARSGAGRARFRHNDNLSQKMATDNLFCFIFFVLALGLIRLLADFVS